jgi:uncharacterized membrane protein (UPF0136 family)
MENMGTYDKSLRIIAAILLMAFQAGGLITGTWGIMALLVAGIFIWTSSRSSCPIYSAIGYNSSAWDPKD